MPTALVGSSRGIGRGIAVALGGLGWPTEEILNVDGGFHLRTL